MDFVCDFSEFSLNSGKSEFVFKAISKTEIEHYIKNMNPNKSVRSNVPSKSFVKLSAKIISLYLSNSYVHIFLNCITNLLSMVCFLSLKYAEVVPNYKSGKKNDVNNYRPISLLFLIFLKSLNHWCVRD